jgi:Protein of unknown function (DUF1499)
MIGRTTLIPEPYAKLSQRVALFAVLLLVVTLIAHRVSWLATPVMVNLLGCIYVLAGIALALGLLAATSIWIRGRTGAWSAAWGLMLSGALWLWPVAILPTYWALPKISDVSTVTTNVPAFAALARQRVAGANPVAYPGARNASQQAQAYPDLRTLVIQRSAEEVYEVTLALLRGRRGLGWKVLAEDAPQTRGGRPGIIEATDRTLILGFTDDIVIRISGTEADSRVDIRSASRYGQHDFGTNASRIRRFVRELATRLDQTGPVGVAGGIAGRGGVRALQADTSAAGAKRPIERNSEKAAPKR